MEAKPISPEAVEVGRNIREARRRLNLTGKQVQARSGIDPTTLSFLERGIREASQKHLRSLSVALGVPMATLLGSTLGVPNLNVNPPVKGGGVRRGAGRSARPVTQSRS